MPRDTGVIVYVAIGMAVLALLATGDCLDWLVAIAIGVLLYHARLI